MMGEMIIRLRFDTTWLSAGLEEMQQFVGQVQAQLESQRPSGEAALAEAKSRIDEMKKELADVKKAAKNVVKQSKDVVDAAKGNKRRGKKPVDSPVRTSNGSFDHS